jgi:hypothetical protein
VARLAAGGGVADWAAGCRLSGRAGRRLSGRAWRCRGERRVRGQRVSLACREMSGGRTAGQGQQQRRRQEARGTHTGGSGRARRAPAKVKGGPCMASLFFFWWGGVAWRLFVFLLLFLCRARRVFYFYLFGLYALTRTRTHTARPAGEVTGRGGEMAHTHGTRACTLLSLSLSLGSRLRLLVGSFALARLLLTGVGLS